MLGKEKTKIKMAAVMTVLNLKDNPLISKS